MAIAILRALPEFALILAGKHGFVFLALVFENGAAFAHQFRGAEGDGHFDFFRFPFLPGAAVQPDFAFLGPGLVFELLERLENGG